MGYEEEKMFKKPKNPAKPIKNGKGVYKWCIEYLNGNRETAFGYIWKLPWDEYFFDKTDTPPDWAERWNNWRFAPRKVSSEDEISEIAGSPENVIDFKKRWVWEHCNQITRSFWLMRGAVDSGEWAKYDKESLIYDLRFKIIKDATEKRRKEIKERYKNK